MTKEEIANAILSLETQMGAAPNIGIGITEFNRYDTFKKSYDEIKRFAPAGAKIVVVDDASTKPVPEANFRFEKNVGIAVAKNKCFELLEGCDHIFLFDSDTYPIHPDWWKPYVESPEPHLNYIFKDFSDKPTLNDTKEIYRDSHKVAYSHVRGCMMYYHRSALEKAGGMNPIFGKWGYEHPNLSDRIYMMGLTSFRYMDVVGSEKLIYSLDEHRQVKTTVAIGERMPLIKRNKEIYDSLLFDKTYVPYIEKENILLTCYFVGVDDPQRGKKWEANALDLELLERSLKNTRLVLLTDCFEQSNDGKVEVIRVETTLNPYIQRWVSYREYLMANRHRIKNVFCIDATDVEVLKEPEWDSLGDNIWVGDENETLDCAWMRNMHPVKALLDFFAANPKTQVLNAGISGGSLDTVCEFIRQLVDFYCLSGIGKTDMGAFNFILRSNWQGRIRSGREVCTLFKGDERNSYSWFKHK